MNRITMKLAPIAAALAVAVLPVTVITGQCTGTANGDDFEVNAGETGSFKLGAK